jgi:carboxymethylenebutenolidase
MIAPDQDQPSHSVDRFQSGGKEIRIETFTGSNTSTAPSVMVLHGATGVEFANRFIATLGHGFASQGFVIHLIHYFDRTGARYADAATIKGSSGYWLETIHDAACFLRAHRPKARLGIFGYSLGGYLAAAEAIRNEQVGAVVVLAGGIDSDSAQQVVHTPPTLILHGDADSRVPLSEAYRLENALTRGGLRPQMHVYPREGHIMKPGAYADVMRRASRFFQVHLGEDAG